MTLITNLEEATDETRCFLVLLCCTFCCTATILESIHIAKLDAPKNKETDLGMQNTSLEPFIICPAASVSGLGEAFFFKSQNISSIKNLMILYMNLVNNWDTGHNQGSINIAVQDNIVVSYMLAGREDIVCSFGSAN
ncbi:hypothetical protein ACJX0J_041061 [Zea mays]